MEFEEQLKDIRSERGKIITNFAYIELMMSELIAFHYTESQEKNDQMIQDVLEDEYFNYGLRRRIFKKVVEKYYKNKNFPLGKLIELGKLRNIIAHATIRNNTRIVGELHLPQTEPFYWHSGEQRDCVKLHQDYDFLSNEVTPVLKEMTKSETVEWSKIIKKISV